ncbi:MAG TPA: DUF748 domain-containing protein [Methylomirabilota bacterium]|jgi:hypothetical protein
MRAVLSLVALAALIFGASGAATFMLERALGRLAPGGIQFDALHYDPVTGAVAVKHLRGRDAEGRVMFEADHVTATAGLLDLLSGELTLRRVHVTAPTVTVRRDDAADLLSLVPMPSALPAAVTGVARRRSPTPWAIEGLMITGGSLIVEQGDDYLPVVIDDIELRLSRLAAARDDDTPAAFALEMATYGTIAQVTGYTVAGPGLGFAVRVRASDLDVAALVRDIMSPVEADDAGALEQARGDVDLTLRVAEGRLVASGAVRLGPLVWTEGGVPTARAAGLNVVIDRLDLATLTGRISRLDVLSPSLSLVRDADGDVALPSFLSRLPDVAPGVVVRRLRVTDGEVNVLDPASGARLALRRLTLTAQSRELTSAAGAVVDARAVVGRDGRLTVSGIVGPRLRSFDGAVRLQDVPLMAWQPVGVRAATVSFDGHIRVDADGEIPRGVVAGRAVLGALSIPDGDGGTAFSVESATVNVRKLAWPSLEATLDSVVLVRPQWLYDLASPAPAWPRGITIASGSVVNGRVRADADAPDGAALDDINVALSPDLEPGQARVTVSAAARAGRVVAFSRAYQITPAASGPSVAMLLSALTEAYRASRDGRF